MSSPSSFSAADYAAKVASAQASYSADMAAWRSANGWKLEPAGSLERENAVRKAQAWRQGLLIERGMDPHFEAPMKKISFHEFPDTAYGKLVSERITTEPGYKNAKDGPTRERYLLDRLKASYDAYHDVEGGGRQSSGGGDAALNAANKGTVGEAAAAPTTQSGLMNQAIPGSPAARAK